MVEEKIIIDASGSALGRIAAYASKQALLGKKVIIINCEKAIITGTKANIINNYRWKRSLGGDILTGPNFPSNPEMIMKRTTRGMLPYRQEKGRNAWKRIICFNSIPREYEKERKIKLEEKSGLELRKLTDILRGQ